MIFRKNDKKNKDEDNLLVNFPSRSRYAESYRTLRTNLFCSVMEKDIKSVVVTSSVEKEGKTNTAVNLAYTMAQTDRKVLLIDGDLRRPHLSSLFSLKKEVGFSGLVSEVLGTRPTRGTLDRFSVNDLVLLTRLQQRSCQLELVNNDRQVTISFEKGRMTDVCSKVPSLNGIEAVKTLFSMVEGTFAFSSLSTDEKRASMDQDLDFKKCCSECAVDRGQLNYVGSAIDSAIKATDTENLFLLPAGVVPPNPLELLGSSRTEFLIAHLKSRFDFIVIDTPPVMPATDALVMGPRTDGTIFIINAGYVNRKIIQSVINQFKNADQPILGCVLNRVDMKKEGYYRYYKKYYQSYYGQ